MIYHKIISCVAFLLITNPFLFAQEAVPATGGDAVGSGGSFSYTVGQTVYMTNSGVNYSEAQGVQQPYEISSTVGIELTGINLNSSIYPNPSNNFIYLNIENYDNQDLSFELYNLQGQLILREKIQSEFTSIPLHNYSESVYTLKVIKKEYPIKIFRVSKI